jgi:hypothetical protein
MILNQKRKSKVSRGLLDNFSIEQISDAILESYGNIKQVAERLHCGRNAVYDAIDIYPELKEVVEKARYREEDGAVDKSKDAIETMLDLLGEHPDLALKQAQFILKNSKLSPYCDKGEDSKISTGTNPATMARMAVSARAEAARREEARK